MNSRPSILRTTAVFRGKTALRLPSFVLLIVFAFTNILFAHKPEAALWEARRARAASPLKTTPAIPMPALRTGLATREGAVPSSIAAEIRPWAAVQSVLRAEKPSHGRTVLILQDIHGHAQAQAAICDAVVHLAARHPQTVVGLEGASGPILAANVRSPFEWVNRETAAILQSAGLIAGTDAAVLLSPAGTRFIGLEDASLYNANSEAVRAALATRESDTAAAVRRTDMALRAIRGGGNDALAALAERRRSAARGDIPFPEFVAQLVEHPRFEHATEQLTLFYQALKLERSLNLPLAETQRAAAVREMASRLDAPALSALADLAADLSAGRLEHAAFYNEFHRRAAKAGLRWSTYPEFERYIRYAALSGSIRADRLTSEAETALESIAARLARSVADRAAWATFRGAERGEKLAALSMTPADWAAFAPQAGVTPSERFYRLAEERNTAMCAAWRAGAAEAKLGLIITGGYHARAMADALRRDADVILATPRITDVKAGDYLAGFLAAPAPLDLLFEAPRITLVRSLALQPIEGSGSGLGTVNLAHELATAIPQAARAGRSVRTTAGRILQVWRRGAQAPEAAGATVFEAAGPNISVRVARRRRWAAPLLSRHQGGQTPKRDPQRVLELGLNPDLTRTANEAAQTAARTEAVKALANIFIAHLRPLRSADATTPEALRAIVTRAEFVTDLSIHWARLQQIEMNLNLLRRQEREYLNRLASGAEDTGFCLFAANTGVRTIQFNNRALMVEVVQVPYKNDLFHAYIRVRFPGNPTAYALDFAPVQFFGPSEPVVLQPEDEYFERLMGVAGRFLSDAGQRSLLEARIANIERFVELDRVLQDTLPGGDNDPTLVTRKNRDQFTDWPLWALALIVAPLDEAVDSFRPLEFHRSHGPQGRAAAIARWVGISAIWVGILATPFVIGLLGGSMIGAEASVSLVSGGIFATLSVVAGRRLGRDGASLMHWVLAAPGLAGSVVAHAAYNLVMLIVGVMVEGALDALLARKRVNKVALHPSISHYPLPEQLDIAASVLQRPEMAEKYAAMGKGTITLAYAPHPEAPDAELLAELHITESDLTEPANVRSALRHNGILNRFELVVIIGPAISNDLIRYIVHHVGSRPAALLRGDMYTPEGRRLAERVALAETQRIVGQSLMHLPNSRNSIEMQGEHINSALLRTNHLYAVETAPAVKGGNPVRLVGVRHDEIGAGPTIAELDRIAAEIPADRPIVLWMELGGYMDNRGSIVDIDGLPERLAQTSLGALSLGQIVQRIRQNDPALKEELAVLFQLGRHMMYEMNGRPVPQGNGFVGEVRAWIERMRGQGRTILHMMENPDFESQWSDLRARVAVQFRDTPETPDERPSDLMIEAGSMAMRKESLIGRDMPLSQAIADAVRRYPGATHVVVRGARHEIIVTRRLRELGVDVSPRNLIPSEVWERYVNADWPAHTTPEGRRLLLIDSVMSMMLHIPGAAPDLVNRIASAFLNAPDDWIELVATHVDKMNSASGTYIWLWQIWHHLPPALSDLLREMHASLEPLAPYWFVPEAQAAILVAPRLEAIDSMAPLTFLHRHRSPTWWAFIWRAAGVIFIAFSVVALPTLAMVVVTHALFGGDVALHPIFMLVTLAISGASWAAGYRLERETRPGARRMAADLRNQLHVIATPALVSSMFGHMAYNILSIATTAFGKWRLPALTLPRQGDNESGIHIDPSFEAFPFPEETGLLRNLLEQAKDAYRRIGPGTLTVAFAPNPDAPSPELLARLGIREQDLSDTTGARSAVVWDPGTKRFSAVLVIGPGFMSDLMRFHIYHVLARIPLIIDAHKTHRVHELPERDVAAAETALRIAPQMLPRDEKNVMVSLLYRHLETELLRQRDLLATRRAMADGGATNPVRFVGMRHSATGLAATLEALDRLAAELPAGVPMIFWMEHANMQDHMGVVLDPATFQTRLAGYPNAAALIANLPERIEQDDPELKAILREQFETVRSMYVTFDDDQTLGGAFNVGIQRWVARQRTEGRVVVVKLEHPDFEHNWRVMKARLGYDTGMAIGGDPEQLLLEHMLTPTYSRGLGERDAPLADAVTSTHRRYPGAVHVVLRGARHTPIFQVEAERRGLPIRVENLEPNPAWEWFVRAGYPDAGTTGRRAVLVDVMVYFLLTQLRLPSLAALEPVSRAMLDPADPAVTIYQDAVLKRGWPQVFALLWEERGRLTAELRSELEKLHQGRSLEDLVPDVPAWTVSLLAAPQLEAIDAMLPVTFHRRHGSATPWDAIWRMVGVIMIIACAIMLPVLLIATPATILLQTDATWTIGIHAAILVSSLASYGNARRLALEKEGRETISPQTRRLVGLSARSAVVSGMAGHFLYNLLSVATIPLGRWRIPPLTLSETARPDVSAVRALVERRLPSGYHDGWEKPVHSVMPGRGQATLPEHLAAMIRLLDEAADNTALPEAIRRTLADPTNRDFFEYFILTHDIAKRTMPPEFSTRRGVPRVTYTGHEAASAAIIENDPAIAADLPNRRVLVEVVRQHYAFRAAATGGVTPEKVNALIEAIPSGLRTQVLPLLAAAAALDALGAQVPDVSTRMEDVVHAAEAMGLLDTEAPLVEEATVSDAESAALLDSAMKIVRRARSVLEFESTTGVTSVMKRDNTFVTNVDKAVQRNVTEMVLQMHPDHHVLAEEELDSPDDAPLNTRNAANAASPYVWVLDPIDGTDMFRNGMDYFAISLALYHNGKPVLTVIYSPFFGWLTAARHNGLPRLNDRPILMASAGTPRASVSGAGMMGDAIAAAMSPASWVRRGWLGSSVVGGAEVLMDHYSYQASIGKGARLWDVAGIAYAVVKAGGAAIGVENGRPIPLMHLIERNINDPARRDHQRRYALGTRAAIRTARPAMEEAVMSLIRRHLPARYHDRWDIPNHAVLERRGQTVLTDHLQAMWDVLANPERFPKIPEKYRRLLGDPAHREFFELFIVTHDLAKRDMAPQPIDTFGVPRVMYSGHEALSADLIDGNPDIAPDFAEREFLSLLVRIHFLPYTAGKGGATKVSVQEMLDQIPPSQRARALPMLMAACYMDTVAAQYPDTQRGLDILASVDDVLNGMTLNTVTANGRTAVSLLTWLSGAKLLYEGVTVLAARLAGFRTGAWSASRERGFVSIQGPASARLAIPLVAGPLASIAAVLAAAALITFSIMHLDPLAAWPMAAAVLILIAIPNAVMAANLFLVNDPLSRGGMIKALAVGPSQSLTIDEEGDAARLIELVAGDPLHGDLLSRSLDGAWLSAAIKEGEGARGALRALERRRAIAQARLAVQARTAGRPDQSETAHTTWLAGRAGLSLAETRELTGNAGATGRVGQIRRGLLWAAGRLTALFAATPKAERIEAVEARATARDRRPALAAFDAGLIITGTPAERRATREHLVRRLRGYEAGRPGDLLLIAGADAPDEATLAAAILSAADGENLGDRARAYLAASAVERVTSALIDPELVFESAVRRLLGDGDARAMEGVRFTLHTANAARVMLEVAPRRGIEILLLLADLRAVPLLKAVEREMSVSRLVRTHA